MGAGNKLGKDDVNWELEFARLAVNIAFAYWFWCQRRMRQLVDAHDAYSRTAWLVLFRELRRESRNAEFTWVSALYSFKQLMEHESGDAGQS
jgi:hypothetical protein